MLPKHELLWQSVFKADAPKDDCGATGGPGPGSGGFKPGNDCAADKKGSLDDPVFNKLSLAVAQAGIDLKDIKAKAVKNNPDMVDGEVYETDPEVLAAEAKLAGLIQAYEFYLDPPEEKISYTEETHRELEKLAESIEVEVDVDWADVPVTKDDIKTAGKAAFESKPHFWSKVELKQLTEGGWLSPPDEIEAILKRNYGEIGGFGSAQHKDIERAKYVREQLKKDGRESLLLESFGEKPERKAHFEALSPSEKNYLGTLLAEFSVEYLGESPHHDHQHSFRQRVHELNGNTESQLLKATSPSEWKPFGPTVSGSSDSDSTSRGAVDYKITQAVASELQKRRSDQIAVERQLEEQVVRYYGDQFWSNWKESSSNETSMLAKVAAHEEFGTLHRISKEDYEKYTSETARSFYVEPFPRRRAPSNREFVDYLKAHLRATWETTQFVLEKSSEDYDQVELYRGLVLDSDGEFDAKDVESYGEYKKLKDFGIVRSALQSTSVSSGVANSWRGVGKKIISKKNAGSSNLRRVVLKLKTDREDLLSIPVYGKNYHKEQEVVLLGTEWEDWGAWLDAAPEKEVTKVSEQKSLSPKTIKQYKYYAFVDPDEGAFMGSVTKSADAPKSDCGANAPGGGGFQPGNDCAADKDGSGDEPASGKRTKAFDEWFGNSKVVDENGEPLVLYHGTSQVFDDFSELKRGSLTDAESASMATFFTDDEKTANAYAIHAAEYGPVKDALDKANLAEKRQDWESYDKFIREAEFLDAYDQKQQRRKDSAKTMKVYLRGDFMVVDAEGKTPQDWSNDENIDSWLTSKLKEAKAEGKDGVRFDNLDDAVGLYNRPATHFAVFNPDGNVKDIDNKNPTDDPSIHKSADAPKSDCGANAPGGGGFQPGNDCAAGRNETPDTLSKKIEQSGGYTYRPADDSSPDSGFSVSIFPEREEIMELSEATPEAIADYIINNLDILQSDERVHIGAWYNKKTDENTDGDDKVYFDLAVVLDDQEEAVQLAKDNGQLKIFDLGSFEEIVTLTPEERKKWEDEQNNKSQPHFSKAKIMGRRRNRKDGDQLVQGYAGAKARPARASRSKSTNSQANGVACLPPHETLWLSVFKSDDGPKSDCGANAPGGGGFQPGNDCAAGGQSLSVADKGVENKTGDYAIDDDVPAKAGSVEIPDNHVRFFHYSSLRNEDSENTGDAFDDANKRAESIRQNGIKMGSARGERFGEPNQIWATVTNVPDNIGEKVYVEFSLPFDDPRIGGTISGNKDVKEARSASQATFIGDIKPSEIIAVHEPWHKRFRYAVMDDDERTLDSKVLDRAASGYYDHILDPKKKHTSDYQAAYRRIIDIAKRRKKSLPCHELLWLSVFKSDDGPKSDCGANAPGGGGFQPGNDCAADKDGKKKKKSSKELFREEVLENAKNFPVTDEVVYDPEDVMYDYNDLSSSEQQEYDEYIDYSLEELEYIADEHEDEWKMSDDDAMDYVYQTAHEEMVADGIDINEMMENDEQAFFELEQPYLDSAYKKQEEADYQARQEWWQDWSETYRDHMRYDQYQVQEYFVDRYNSNYTENPDGDGFINTKNASGLGLNKWGKDKDGDFVLRFETEAGTPYTITTYDRTPQRGKTHRTIMFDQDGKYGVEGTGSAHEVFSKVIGAIASKHQEAPADVYTFTAAEPSRKTLYKRLVRRLGAVFPELKGAMYDKGGSATYVVGNRDYEKLWSGEVDKKINDAEIILKSHFTKHFMDVVAESEAIYWQSVQKSGWEGSICKSKYDGIDFSVTPGMISAAKRGLELRKKHKRGGTAVGATRAGQIINRKKLSPDTWKRVFSYFSRHEVDKQGKGWGKDSAGYIAWLLWGGDAGFARSRKITKQMKARDGKKSLPRHESLWISVFKAAEQDKNDCGATGGPGPGSGGFTQGNDCASAENKKKPKGSSKFRDEVLEDAKKFKVLSDEGEPAGDQDSAPLSPDQLEGDDRKAWQAYVDAEINTMMESDPYLDESDANRIAQDISNDPFSYQDFAQKHFVERAKNKKNVWQWGSGPFDSNQRQLKFETSSGREFQVKADEAPLNPDSDIYQRHVAFQDEKGSYKITGRGEAHEVISNVLASLTALQKQKPVEVITFTSDEESRTSLYKLLTKRISRVFPEMRSGMVQADEGTTFVVGKRELWDDIKEDAGSMFITQEDFDEIEIITKSMQAGVLFEAVGNAIKARTRSLEAPSRRETPDNKKCQSGQSWAEIGLLGAIGGRE